MKFTFRELLEYARLIKQTDTRALRAAWKQACRAEFGQVCVLIEHECARRGEGIRA